MSTINERILQLRNSAGMGRTLWARHVGINPRTVAAIEYDGNKPGAEILAAIAKAYPQYILWILTGTADSKVGQIKPPGKAKARRASDS